MYAMSVSIKISRELAYGLGLGLGFIVTPGLVFRLIVLSAEIGVTFSTYFRHDTLLLFPLLDRTSSPPLMTNTCKT